MRASLLSSRIFLKSALSTTSDSTSAEISAVISALTLFMSEASLLADALAKKASVEIVRIAMNFVFMILPMVVGGFFFHPVFSKNRANFGNVAKLRKFRCFCSKSPFCWS